MQPYLNALLMKWEGDDTTGANAPTKAQVATTWGLTAVVVMLLVR